MTSMMRTAFAALAVLVMAGCATKSAGAGDGAGELLRVTVENDGAIPTHVRVFLVRQGGEEMMVGTMSTLGTETLTLNGRYPGLVLPAGGGGHRLRAHLAAGDPARRRNPHLGHAPEHPQARQPLGGAGNDKAPPGRPSGRGFVFQGRHLGSLYRIRKYPRDFLREAPRRTWHNSEIRAPTQGSRRQNRGAGSAPGNPVPRPPRGDPSVARHLRRRKRVQAWRSLRKSYISGLFPVSVLRTAGEHQAPGKGEQRGKGQQAQQGSGLHRLSGVARERSDPGPRSRPAARRTPLRARPPA